MRVWASKRPAMLDLDSSGEEFSGGVGVEGEVVDLCDAEHDEASAAAAPCASKSANGGVAGASPSPSQMRDEVKERIRQAPLHRQMAARYELSRLDEAQLRAAHGVLVVQPAVAIVGGAAGTGKSALLCCN